MRLTGCGLDGLVRGHGRGDRLAGNVRPRGASVRGLGAHQGEGDPASGGVDHLRGLFHADAQAAGLSDAFSQPVKDLGCLQSRGGRGPGPGVFVRERVEGRVGEAELNVKVPPPA